MKTYLKLFCHFTALGSLLLIFGTSSASASIKNVGIPASSEELILPEEFATLSSNLQIVAVVPFEYIGGVNVRCFGQNNGSATVEVAGGTGPYTFQWSGLPNQTNATANGMSAGTYTVTVTDALGFSVSEDVTLIENPPVQGIVHASPILCHGGVSTVIVSASGGTAPYSGLNWFQFTAGNYTFNVADANGCRSSVIETISEPPVFKATSFATPILCHGDLSNVSVDGLGGTPPYNGTGSYYEPSGTPNYVITDANGCFAYTSLAISEPKELIAEINYTPVLCRGDKSEITVNGSGGMAPYMGIGVFEKFAGQYQFTVVDGNGCESSSSVMITPPIPLVATISNTPVACHGDLSEVTVTATGGATPYIGTGSFFESAGWRSYEVADANGCNVEIATIVLEPAEIQLNITIGTFDTALGTASVEVVATGGVSPYTGTGSFNFGSGMHLLTVTDANGCSVSQSVSIGEETTSSSSIAVNNENSVSSMKKNAIYDNHDSFVRASFNIDREEGEIAYQLNYDSKVRIEILDMTGAIVDVIEEDMAIEGEKHTVSIESGRLNTGVYIYQFITDSERQIDKFQVIR